jgi:hypothetical protein
MKAGDFLLYRFEGDTAIPPKTYVAEILSIDAASLTCRQLDNGQQYIFQYSTNTSGPWQGQDPQGGNYSIDPHDAYTGTATDPVAQEAALVTFADNNRYLCVVQSISPTIDVVFCGPPYGKLSIDVNVVSQSDWDAYPTGAKVLSIERYVMNNELVQPAGGVFNNGWWSLARQFPANAGRIGADIVPFAVVVHTTDMVPESWDALLQSWSTQAGAGDCAHFIIGRDAANGMVQLAPITKNANHAGGPGHGSFVAGQQTWHPNSVSVGIEVHCAGILRQVNGAWRLVEDGVAQGAALPDGDVIQDPARPGVGYHVVTDYQYQQLGLLLDGLESVLTDLPAGCVAQSVEQPPAYGVFPTGRRVGHVSLDAAHRGDPWPATCDWMRARG